MPRKRKSAYKAYSKTTTKKIDDPYLNPKHHKVSITAKNDEQKQMLRTMSDNHITFVRGAAGTGKTFLAVAYALQELLSGHYSRILLSRPTVEAAGEKLGFLPGDIAEKIDPYMLPIFESMSQLMPYNTWRQLVGKELDSPIRVLPLAYMRGCTFLNTFVVLDEMQNASSEQMHMALTRFGENSKLIICGDVNQSDIHKENGLQDAFKRLIGIEDIGFCTLTYDAVVRHPIIKSIAARYEEQTI